MGLTDQEINPYGKFKAKIALDTLARLADQPNGNYVVVTSMTPTPLGEGKTTTTLGLAMALNRVGQRAAVSMRQPSLGPVFGVKGGGTGGGHARVLPIDDINLHLTGDTHAVAIAHNLLASFLDNHLYHGNALDVDPFSITWPRVLDVNDRALRHIAIGLGGREGGMPRETGFELAVSSEVMATLAMANSLSDLRARLGRIVVAMSRSGKPITADDLQCAGAMTAILRDAIEPNLLQTVEHTPALIHTGPFGSIAHGNNSILADEIALKLNDYVITESGLGSDLGMEKFFDIKCRYSGLQPRAVVLVATTRALKMHGGVGNVIAGRPLPEELVKENLPALERGSANLIKHIENALWFGVPVVVAVNRFESDSEREIALVEKIARESGAEGAFVSDAYSRGGAGAISLAEAVVHACKKQAQFKFLYPLDLPSKGKIERIADRIFGAEGVDYLPLAEQKIKRFTDLGLGNLPVCMAKTHLSLSHDEKLKGRPRRFRVPVRDVRLAAGAGYLVVMCGDVRTMPALPRVPAGTRVDVDEHGNISGLH